MNIWKKLWICGTLINIGTILMAIITKGYVMIPIALFLMVILYLTHRKIAKGIKLKSDKDV